MTDDNLLATECEGWELPHSISKTSGPFNEILGHYKLLATNGTAISAFALLAMRHFASDVAWGDPGRWREVHALIRDRLFALTPEAATCVLAGTSRLEGLKRMARSPQPDDDTAAFWPGVFQVTAEALDLPLVIVSNQTSRLFLPPIVRPSTRLYPVWQQLRSRQAITTIPVAVLVEATDGSWRLAPRTRARLSELPPVAPGHQGVVRALRRDLPIHEDQEAIFISQALSLAFEPKLDKSFDGKLSSLGLPPRRSTSPA